MTPATGAQTTTIPPAHTGRNDESRGQEGGPTRPAIPTQAPGEIGGPPGPEPTRYGDWENKGRCSDF